MGNYGVANVGAAIAFSFLGFMIGVIPLLTHGGLENLGTLGPKLAFPSITVFYGLILGYMGRPYSMFIRNQKRSY